MSKTTGSAPNYKKACIVMFGVNLSWIFMAIWAFWGLFAVAATGWCIHRAIRHLEARQG